jgi:MFS family permease
LVEQQDRTTFRSVFAVREFRAIWAAEALSQMGDQLARVALAVLVYQRTESAALTGLTYALTLAPAFLGGVFLAGLADRFPRREVMVVADVLRAVLIALVAVPGVPFPVLCVLVAGVSFFQAPFKAAQLALLPAVLPGDLYVVGMGIRSITMQTAQMIGFAGGGVLVSAIDPHVALALDAITFVASALFVRAGVKRREVPAPAADATKPSFGSSALAGAKLIWRSPGLRILVLVGWLSAFLIVYEGLAAPYTAEIGGGAIAIGLILAADPLGSVVGAVLFSRWVPAATRPKILGTLTVLSCLPLLVCFLKPGLVVSIIVFAVAGALGTAVMMQSTASFTRGVPDHSRAQALGLSQSGVATIQGLSPLVAGLAADQIGTAHTVGLVGIVGLVIAIPAAVAWKRATAARPDVWLAAAEGR